MTVQIFSLETIDTPTGRMRIITDDEGRLRSVDWDDHESRMMKLLARHCGTNSFSLRESADVGGRAGAGGVFRWRGFCGRHPADEDPRHRIPMQDMGSLRTIPVGHSISYGALAARIGRPGASRAVGLANGANPIAIVVPCHRVIGADSSLTGYGGGLERKRWLLAHERAHRPTSEFTAIAHGSLRWCRAASIGLQRK